MKKDVNEINSSENIEEVVFSEEAQVSNLSNNIKEELENRYQETDPYKIIGELEAQVSNLQQDYDNLKTEYEKSIGERESLNNVIRSQSNQIQILNSNLERSEVTLDAVQEKLVKVIRLYNNSKNN
ncbi:hypothetical protein [uncultured Clostridium sp.]|uniref:hypothetical protein n=1 Tax=uncultured Clostridium sp. TaxID=59620 RepID=UPI0026058872|nr:hypothetical protein [uncultured Clostridium sp.]